MGCDVQRGLRCPWLGALGNSKAFFVWKIEASKEEDVSLTKVGGDGVIHVLAGLSKAHVGAEVESAKLRDLSGEHAEGAFESVDLLR